MRLSSIKYTPTSLLNSNEEVAAIVCTNGIVPIPHLNKMFHTQWPEDLFNLIQSGELESLSQWYQVNGKRLISEYQDLIIPQKDIHYAPLFRHPKKIFGIGLNYVDHATDLAEKAPTEIPASFLKADTTIIGHQDAIQLSPLSTRTTGEAELGIILGKTTKNIDRENWLSVVAGFTTILDITAEDILRQNPRYLTLAKNFDTFFSFGPEFVTPDEISDLQHISVATILNGTIHAQNTIANMTFPPDFLVSFHSQIMTWQPGDILSTGTPRAVSLKSGDILECHIDGFIPLINPVI